MIIRPRRLRTSEAMRQLVAQTHVSVSDLVYPMFVVEGQGIKAEISSMPDVYHFSIDTLLLECESVVQCGIQAVLLFGVIPQAKKDAIGSMAYQSDAIVAKAIDAIKQKFPKLLVIADVCLCEYTDHGHCGIVKHDKILNDPTVPLLAKTALCYAKAGADVVAPSDMMDGRVQAIREALDQDGFEDVLIMSYSAKYASAFYGPFREAAGSAPIFGDRKTYQMDYRNQDEAVKEVLLDIQEGADIVMVKPAGAYLDIITRIADTVNMPVAAYQVSGEYAMLKAAAQNGWIDEQKAVVESIYAIKRAGAKIILTYYAKQLAQWLKDV
ncbi:MAG: porphobilinogen synthase [Hyphomonadaceae bacterium]|nr:porphobilinogen synthase [Clostridia bacterium]